MKTELNDTDLGVIETIRHVIGRLTNYQRVELDNMYNYFDSQEIFFNLEGVKWLSFYMFDDGGCMSFLDFLKEHNIETETIFGKPSEEDKDKEKIDDIIFDFMKNRESSEDYLN